MRCMETYFRQQAIGTNKRSRTRGVLIDSAVEIFSEQGFADAKISTIATAAGLSNGTFYNHFKDKEELATAAAAAIALEIAKQLDRQMGDLGAGVSRVVAGSSAFLRLASLHVPWGAVLLDQFRRHPDAANEAMRYMRADIERAVVQRALDVVVDDFLLSQMSALMGVALHRQLEEGFDANLVQRTCEHMLRVLGLTPKQARREVVRVAEHPLLQPSLAFSGKLAVNSAQAN